MQLETDVAVIGGGLVGIALGYGLSLRGIDNVVLDEGDDAIRASRGNFGLVWVQAKGLGLPAYSNWAMHAVSRWPELSDQLLAETGIDVELVQNGGLYLCRTPEELETRAANLATIQSRHAGDYDYDILDNAALRRLVPEIGPDVPGASYSRYDGQANPLRLLQAFHRAYQKRGGRALANSGVLDITRRGEKFVLKTARGEIVAGRIALAAGLGNAGLGDMLGVKIPLLPVRGQVLVTERVPMKLDYAIEQVRGTGDGTLMIGGSWEEEAGYDLGTTFDVTTRIAADSMFFFPFLENIRVVRSWSALRIITPDAAPAYEEVVPGAFLITCHSGVSLAALHAYESAGWLAEGAIPEAMAPFSLARFSDQR
ncbi:FAD-binding oxidoreductase [Martelella mediterranea]|uniref:NAD(P)/FAD-dependent oxidoreductase n=1 Tax=Martelella mediterranea TaxID=293089 RepID=UPI001E4AC7D8|nr:FAD-dependent oxidoreductase [Martelella mediterranea]MCD1634328.1 FAD-binding oxidoreductase [Martelella mediterranea]